MSGSMMPTENIDPTAHRDLPLDEHRPAPKPAPERREPPQPPAPVSRSDIWMRVLWAGFWGAVALFSFFVVARYVSDPATYASTIAALDDKRTTVMNLMTASTGSSAAITLLPGDAGTPIAEKLVDLSSDFLVVIAAIYLEKYLLTVLGFISSKVLVPAACVLFGSVALMRQGTPLRDIALNLGVKLLVFGLGACLVVPTSVYISSMIERTYEVSIEQTIATAEQTTAAIEESAEEGEAEDSSNPLGFLLDIPGELQKLTDSAQRSLGNFIEALAVMIVTSCVIPILVLVFFLWMLRAILGIDIQVPRYGHRHRR